MKMRFTKDQVLSPRLENTADLINMHELTPPHASTPARTHFLTHARTPAGKLAMHTHSLLLCHACSSCISRLALFIFFLLSFMTFFFRFSFVFLFFLVDLFPLVYFFSHFLYSFFRLYYLFPLIFPLLLSCFSLFRSSTLFLSISFSFLFLSPSHLFHFRICLNYLLSSLSDLLHQNNKQADNQ